MSVCSASLKRTISYYPPGKARKLVASHVTSSTVHLAWRAATRGDGRLAGYRVYRNAEVLGQTESTRMTARHLFSGQEYSFYVRAVDTNGIQGPRSRIVTIRTPAPAKTTGNATAFILESDGESFADLQRHYMHVGTILPTYFNCTPAGGSMGVDDPLVTSWALRRGIVVEPRFNCQNVAALKAILTNSAVQQHLISQLVNLTTKYGYQGINIDFESNDALRLPQPAHELRHPFLGGAPRAGQEALDGGLGGVLQPAHRAGRFLRLQGAFGRGGRDLRHGLGQVVGGQPAGRPRSRCRGSRACSATSTRCP